MQIFYLEIVSADVDADCEVYSKMYECTFGEADPNLGMARTATLADGGMVGIRAPMSESEEPVVRPYFLVDDIEATVEAAKTAGAVIALPPMPLPGHGLCSIIIQNEIQTGIWQK